MNKQRREKIRQLKTQIDLIKTNLKKVSSELFSILSEEQDAFDNMPEGLQSSYRGMCSEDAIDSIEEASEKLDDCPVLSQILRRNSLLWSGGTHRLTAFRKFSLFL